MDQASETFSDRENTAPHLLDAGDFSSWLSDATAGKAMDVPCGSCNACCRASFFIHITADEKAALKAIPKALIFDAPGLPKGNYLMGYDDQGHCPMLKENQCSIYVHRPNTCRRFDCRIFAATGIDITDKPDIQAQSNKWRFKMRDAEAEKIMMQLKNCVQFFFENITQFPEPIRSKSEAQLANSLLKLLPIYLKRIEALPFSPEKCIDEMRQFLMKEMV